MPAYPEIAPGVTPANRAKIERVHDLRARAEVLVERQQAAINAADADGRELTATERHAHQRRAKEIDELIEEADQLDHELDQPVNPRAGGSLSDPIGGLGGHRQPVYGAAAGSRGGRTFAATFGQPRDPYGNKFNSLQDFCRAVANVGAGQYDQRLQAAAIYPMVEGEGAAGGFLVPMPYLGPLLDGSLEREIVRPHAMVIPTAGASSVVPGFDTTDRTGGKRAGLRLLWGGEATELSEQRGKAREMTIRTDKGNIFVVVSNELLTDAPGFDVALFDAMARACAAGLDQAFLNGTGAGQPLGAFHGATAIEVPKVSGQAGGTLQLENLAAMAGRLNPEGWSRSRWAVHPTVIPALYMLSYTIANRANTETVGGSHVQAVGQAADGSLTIFGRPVDVSDALEPLGTKGDIMLCDWSRYVITMRQDVRLQRDFSQFFSSDSVAFRLIVRLGGQPADPAPIKLRDGSNTTSPFVALATRA